MDHTIRIGIADDHAIFRKILRSTVVLQPGLRVVAEAENGSAAIAMVEKHRPEMVIMDIGMPVLNGIEATRTIRSKFPGTKVLVLTIHTIENFLDIAYQAGACTLLPKDCSKNELLRAIKDCLHNNRALTAPTAPQTFPNHPSHQHRAPHLRLLRASEGYSR
jgi:two-component system response regulator DegU